MSLHEQIVLRAELVIARLAGLVRLHHAAAIRSYPGCTSPLPYKNTGQKLWTPVIMPSTPLPQATFLSLSSEVCDPFVIPNMSPTTPQSSPVLASENKPRQLSEIQLR